MYVSFTNSLDDDCEVVYLVRVYEDDKKIKEIPFYNKEDAIRKFDDLNREINNGK